MVRTSYHTDSWLSCKHPSPHSHYSFLSSPTDKSIIDTIILFSVLFSMFPVFLSSNIISHHLYFEEWILEYFFLERHESCSESPFSGEGSLIWFMSLILNMEQCQRMEFYILELVSCSVFFPRYFPLSFYSLYLFNPPTYAYLYKGLDC